MKDINLFDLKEISYVPSARTCESYAEAATICLENKGHNQNVVLKVNMDDDNEEELHLNWTPITQQIKDSWSDLQEATEYGAICLAIWVVHSFTDYKVIRRSPKLTGIDYWLGDKVDNYPFQDKARLEISGILTGTKSQVQSRLKEKLKQTKKSDATKLPSLVVIIEFSKPLAKLRSR